MGRTCVGWGDYKSGGSDYNRKVSIDVTHVMWKILWNFPLFCGNSMGIDE